jgi:hypothetical protein
MPADRLPRRAFAANLSLAEQRQRAQREPTATQCWAGQVTALLQKFPAARRPGDNGDLLRVKPAAVERQLRTDFIATFNGDNVGSKTMDYRTNIRGGSITVDQYQAAQYVQAAQWQIPHDEPGKAAYWISLVGGGEGAMGAGGRWTTHSATTAHLSTLHGRGGRG